jgi:phosphogluconate dehydratase
MPELHKLTPLLGVLQDRGHRVALVTDGRMSGASGKIPAAIHLTPEAAAGGPLTRVRDGDIIHLDSETATLRVELSDDELLSRTSSGAPASDDDWVGTGRELFNVFRRAVGDADAGAAVFGLPATSIRDRQPPVPVLTPTGGEPR